MNIQTATVQELQTQLESLEKEYQQFKDLGLQLDMTRGKPSSAQLDLANPILSLPGSDYTTASGVDARNYGGLEGLPEMRSLFADLMQVKAHQVCIGGNSSLTLMHDTVLRALQKGLAGNRPWSQNSQTTFLCPVPGYDRHFSICEHFGINMQTVPMTTAGPDMDLVERLVAEDANIKGIWIVPKYSNPTGFSCSPQTVQRLASMSCKAPDFRIFWDNAYAEHHLYPEAENQHNLVSLAEACEQAGNPDRYYIFASTSKISFAGSGLSAIASSEANIAEINKHRSIQTIGPDKINQLRHLQFFGNYDGLKAHMQKHAAILRPKFEKVNSVLQKRLADQSWCSWSRPKGGYFVNLDVMPQTARTVVAMAQNCGVKLTAAGATFPYKKDPADQNIRIAPSMPPLDDIETAMEVLSISTLMAAIKHSLNN